MRKNSKQENHIAQRKSFKKSEKRLPINGEIRADKIRLISESGEQLGIVSLNEALATA